MARTRQKPSDVRAKLLELMKKERYGRLSDAHVFLVNRDTDFMEEYDALFRFLMTKDRRLRVKEKELIVIGMLAVKGQYNAMKGHVRRALLAGVQVDQMVEVLELAMLYGGTESMIQGGLAMLDVLKELGQKSP